MGRRKKNEKFIETLCWTCKNSIPDGKHGCSWSVDGVPVEGWESTPTRHYNIYTYKVLKCPQYIRDDGNTNYSEGMAPFESLAGAVVTTAMKDYINASNALMENHDAYVEAFEKTKLLPDFHAYAVSLYNKYKIRSNKRHSEPWWEEIATFVSTVRKKNRKMLLPYIRLEHEYLDHARTITECEKFFVSEMFSMYSDANGRRLISDMDSRTGFDREYALFRERKK